MFQQVDLKLKNKTFERIFAFKRKFTLTKRSSLFICFLAGIIGAIPYYIEELFIFTFVSLFLQYYIVFRQKDAKRRVFLPFFCYFIGFYTLVYLFLGELYPYERFGFDEKQAVFIVICSCILIPLLHTVVSAVIMLISKLFKNPLSDILGFACLWVIVEWVMTLGTLAFPWCNVAVSLTGFLPYLQTASVFGKYFITFITVAGCCAFSYAVMSKKRLFGVIGSALILGNTVFGTVLWFIPTEKEETVKTAVVQGNALADEKWTSGSRQVIFDRYMELAEEAAINGAEIIVFPESAIAMSFTPNGKIHRAIAEITTKYNVTVIAGVHYYEDGGSYNAVIGIMPDGSLSERYDKRHLVPFGEFIPFVDIIGEFLPFVAEFNAETGTYIEGNEPIVIETDYGRVAPLVCFDSIFPQFAKEGVENNAEMLAIVTNDSWFNDSFGIYTHLRHAKLRAIENNRYILRAANTGVSAFIDEKGRIIEETEPLTADLIYCDSSRISQNSLYYYVGDFILYASFIVLVIIVLYNIFFKKGEFNNGKDSTPQN